MLHDQADRNPFRQLLGLARDHPVLEMIIIANAALHFANASGHLLQNGSSSRIVHEGQALQAYNDALSAKDQALGMMAKAISQKGQSTFEVLLASMMLFTMFELLDCAKNDWRFHIEGAKQLIAYLEDNKPPEVGSLRALRECLMSNCVV